MRDTTKEAILWGVLTCACVWALVFCLTGCTAHSTEPRPRVHNSNDLPYEVKAFCYHGQEFLIYKYRGGLTKTGSTCIEGDFKE